MSTPQVDEDGYVEVVNRKERKKIVRRSASGNNLVQLYEASSSTGPNPFFNGKVYIEKPQKNQSGKLFKGRSMFHSNNASSSYSEKWERETHEGRHGRLKKRGSRVKNPVVSGNRGALLHSRSRSESPSEVREAPAHSTHNHLTQYFPSNFFPFPRSGFDGSPGSSPPDSPSVATSPQSATERISRTSESTANNMQTLPSFSPLMKAFSPSPINSPLSLMPADTASQDPFPPLSLNSTKARLNISNCASRDGSDEEDSTTRPNGSEERHKASVSLVSSTLRSRPPSPSSSPTSTGTVSVYRMRSLKQLLHHVHPGAFFALDIDDTIYTNAFHPCKLMSQMGVKAFQKHLTEQESMTLKEKNHHIKRLSKDLHKKRFVESCTGSIITSLQEQGCWVFGLTARYSEMQKTTTRVLNQLGLDLSARAPFPKGSVLRDPMTQAVMSQGVIYANATDKGVILDRFLENVVFRGALASPAARRKAKFPPEIIFVDDRVQNVQCVARGLSIAKRLNIPVTCYHYQPPNISSDFSNSPSPPSSPALLPMAGTSPLNLSPQLGPAKGPANFLPMNENFNPNSVANPSSNATVNYSSTTRSVPVKESSSVSEAGPKEATMGSSSPPLSSSAEPSVGPSVRQQVTSPPFQFQKRRRRSRQALPGKQSNQAKTSSASNPAPQLGESDAKDAMEPSAQQQEGETTDPGFFATIATMIKAAIASGQAKEQTSEEEGVAKNVERAPMATERLTEEKQNQDGTSKPSVQPAKVDHPGGQPPQYNLNYLYRSTADEMQEWSNDLVDSDSEPPKSERLTLIDRDEPRDREVDMRGVTGESLLELQISSYLHHELVLNDHQAADAVRMLSKNESTAALDQDREKQESSTVEMKSDAYQATEQAGSGSRTVANDSSNSSENDVGNNSASAWTRPLRTPAGHPSERPKGRDGGGSGHGAKQKHEEDWVAVKASRRRNYLGKSKSSDFTNNRT